MRVLIIALLLIACATAQQFDIDLHNSTNIKIESRILNTPISIGYDPTIPYGSIQIRGFTHGDILLKSSLEDGVMKILLDNEQLESFEYSSSSGYKLGHSFGVIFVCLVTVLLNPKHKLFSVCVVLLLFCCTCYAENMLASKITIHVGYDIQFDSLEITSDSSILVSPNIFRYNQNLTAKCGAKDRLKQCSPMICNISDRSCSVGDGNVGIGILVPIDGDFTELSAGTLSTTDIAAANFGITHPGIKLIVGNTESDADVAVEVAEYMYDMGIRRFVGPSTSLEAIKILEWSETKRDEVVFISPYASANSIFEYDSFFSVYLRNSEIAAIYGSYMAFNDEYYINEVLVVNRDDEYGRDLLEAFRVDNKHQFFNLVEVTDYQPNSLNSPDDVTEILEIVSSNRNETINQVLLFISFGEFQHFLESDIPENLKTLKWYCTDLAFVDSFISSDFAHDNAYDVRLESIQFAGSAVDVTSIERKTFHNQMASRGSVASYFDILLYDAIGLMYESMSKVPTNTDDMDLFKTTIFESAEIMNGISGSLAIDSHGARTGGDSYQSFVLERNPLQRVWKQSYILHFRETPASFTPYYFGVQSIFDMVIDANLFPNCTNAGAFFNFAVGSGEEYILWVDEEAFEDGTMSEVRLTKYIDTTVSLFCDTLRVTYFCPADLVSQGSSCQSFYNTNSTVEYPVTQYALQTKDEFQLKDEFEQSLYHSQPNIVCRTTINNYAGGERDSQVTCYEMDTIILEHQEIDTAVTEDVDLFLHRNQVENWDLTGSPPAAERELIETDLQPVEEMQAQLPAENHDQDSR